MQKGRKLMTDQTYVDPSTIDPSALIPMVIGMLVFSLISVIIGILIYWKIFSKAGFSGWLSLTMLIPLVNIIMMFYLAFAEWPVVRELNQLKQSKQQVAYDA